MNDACRLALIAVLAAPLLGGESPPDPARLLDRAAHANRLLRTAEFDFVQEIVDAKGHPQPGTRAAAHVRFRREELPEQGDYDPRKVGFAFRAKGRCPWSFATGDDEIELAYDGKTMRVRSPAAKRFVEVPLAAAGVSFWELPESAVVPQGLADPGFVRLPPETQHEYLGEEEAGGVPCHRIEAVFGIVKCLPAGVKPEDLGFELMGDGKEKPGPGPAPARGTGTVCYRVKTTVRFWIGKEDLLLRRMGVKVAGLPGLPAGGAWMVETYGNLKVNRKIAAGDFVLQPARNESVERLGTEDVQTMFGPPDLLAKNLWKELGGRDAPTWSLKDPKGATHSLRDYRGKVVVLDFWGSWCGPCVAALPLVQAVHEEFERSGRVVVFGVACKERDAKAPQEVMRKEGCTYTLLLDGDQVAQDYGVRGFPTLLVLGPDGKVVHTEVGLASKDALVAAIRQALGPAAGR